MLSIFNQLMNIRELCPDKRYFKRRILIEDAKKILFFPF